MKTCKKCLRILNVSEFYRHKQMGDGYLSFCKDCVKERISVHRGENLERIRAYDRKRGRSDHRLERTKENSRRYRKEKRGYVRAWEKRNPHKKKSNNTLHGAIRSGKIIRLPCEVCGNKKSEGHHFDYSKPLEVRWLCRKHHGEVHRKHEEMRTLF